MADKPTEKQVKDKVKAVVELFREYHNGQIYTFCPMTFGYGDSGHPDRLVLFQGHFIGIEVKRDKNNYHTRPELKPSASEVAQNRKRSEIIAAGGWWLCIHNDNIAELVALLDRMAITKSTSFSEIDRNYLTKLIGE